MVAFTPFDGNAARVRALLTALFDAGVLCFPAGAHPTRIRFLPPAGAVTDQDIDNVCEILKTVLRAQA